MLYQHHLLLSLLFSLLTAVKGDSPTCENSALCGGSVRRAQATPKQDSPCELYIGESAVNPGTLGLFTGVKLSAGDQVGQPEIIIPILDAKKNEWSPWNDMVDSASTIPKALLESYFINDVFVPGIVQMAACSNKYSNIKPDSAYQVDNGGVHRGTNPSAGSFSYYRDYLVKATKDMLPGEELTLPCGDDSSQNFQDVSRRVLSVDFLQGEAICLDNLEVGPSTVIGAGRGAFAKRAIPVGKVIAPSPVLHFDRSQTEIVEQALYEGNEILPLHRDHGIRYTDKVKGQQLILNYAFGHPDSHVLLVPYAPVVNYINHNEPSKVNAYIRWSTHLLGSDAKDFKSLRPMELFARPAQGDYETLMIEFVALRDIEPGEEIFLSYGEEWEQAYQAHVFKWEQERHDHDYISAADWTAKHADKPIRTQHEQKANPYPDKLQTACFFSAYDIEQDLEEGDIVKWDSESNHKDCLRPCSITNRISIDGAVTYNAIVSPMERFEEPESCGTVPEGGVKVEDMPAWAVTLIDEPYSSDVHQPGVFRHGISLPQNFYPAAWAHADPNPSGDFIPTPLAPGQMDRIHWKDTGDVVLQNAFRLGLSPSVRETLLDYCQRMGITDLFKHVTAADNGLRPGEETNFKLKGFNWFIQRPEKKWYSNLHWLSPADNRAHEHYLQALSIAGFDEMLKGIGEFLGLDSLVVFHVTFIAVSLSTRGYVHTDVSDTGARTFNVIVPLMKAENSPPELDIQENEADGRIGRYPYEINVAAMMGDDSWHGTSAVDYRVEKQMRLAATVYIAEVTEDNVDSIMSDYTQEYPPRDHDLLLSWAGRHWMRGDPTHKLPQPDPDHILLQQPTRIA